MLNGGRAELVEPRASKTLQYREELSASTNTCSTSRRMRAGVDAH
jgi:hypothetical protein